MYSTLLLYGLMQRGCLWMLYFRYHIESLPLRTQWRHGHDITIAFVLTKVFIIVQPWWRNFNPWQTLFFVNIEKCFCPFHLPSPCSVPVLSYMNWRSSILLHTSSSQFTLSGKAFQVLNFQARRMCLFWLDRLRQARNQRGAIGQLPPWNFWKRMYLVGASTSYIILLPPKISLGCGPGLR